MSTEQWALLVAWAALGVACFNLAVLMFYVVIVRRAIRVAPVENMDAILDAIDGVRDQVDSNSLHTQRENEAMVKSQDAMGGRLQFMMAEKIAFELSEYRAKSGAKTPPPEAPTEG